MAQNENISLSLANKIDVLNKTQSIDARYGVYDSESDALTAMSSYGLDGRQVAVYTDKPNGKVQLFLYNETLHQLEPIGGLTPTLQQVTDEGATTTNSITVGGGLSQVDINDDGTIDATSNITGGALVVRNIDGELGSILSDNLTDDREHQLQDKDGTIAHVEDIETAGFIQRTGTAIAFDKWATYGTYASPVSGNLSYSFTNMVKGMIQVMYHEDSLAPTLTAVGVTVIETGDYLVENINKITVHCIDENVVEVNIKAL